MLLIHTIINMFALTCDQLLYGKKIRTMNRSLTILKMFNQKLIIFFCYKYSILYNLILLLFRSSKADLRDDNKAILILAKDME